MTNERLNELKKGVTNMLMICLIKLSDQTAKESVKQTTVDVYALIDQAMKPTSEEVQRAIDHTEFEKAKLADQLRSSGRIKAAMINYILTIWDTILTALQQMQEPQVTNYDEVSELKAQVAGLKKREPCECIFNDYEPLSVITVAVKKVTEYTEKPYYMAQSMPLRYCPNCGKDLRGL